MRELVFDLGPDGEVRYEAVGFQGGACLAAAAPFQEAINGGEPEERTLKPEAATAAVQVRPQVKAQ